MKQHNERIKAYKAFDANLKCIDFQFEVGKEYTHDGDVKICTSGFHACTNPMDCLNYYDLVGSRFCEVELWGDVVSDKEDSKLCARHIKIIRELTKDEFYRAYVDYLYQQCVANLKTEKTLSDNYAQIGSFSDHDQIGSFGYSAKIGSSGEHAKIDSSGIQAKIGSSGYFAQIGSSGYFAQIGSSGDYAKIVSLGDASKISSSGYFAKIGSSGEHAQIGSSGDHAMICSSSNSAKIGASGENVQIGSSGNSSKIGLLGDNAKIEIEGKNSVAAAVGRNGMIKGVKGTWITLAEYDNNGVCVMVKSAQIDGKILKENVFYKLQNGEFVEVT